MRPAALPLASPGTRFLHLLSLGLALAEGCTLYDTGRAQLEIQIVGSPEVQRTLTVRVLAPARVDKVALTVDGSFARDGRTDTDLWIDVSRLAPGTHRVGAVGDGSPWTIPAAEVPFTVLGPVTAASTRVEARSGFTRLPRCTPVGSADLLHLGAHDALECRFFDVGSGRELDAGTLGGITLRDATGAVLPTRIAAAGPVGTYRVSRGSGEGIPGAGSLTIDGVRDVAGLEVPPATIALAWPGWLPADDTALPPDAQRAPGGTVACTSGAPGIPVVAWSLGGTVTVARMGPSGWEPLGLPLTGPSGAAATAPSIGLRPAGTPVVAFETTAGGVPAVMISGWDGGAWSPIGEVLNAGPSRGAFAPSLAVDRTGVVWVALADDEAAGRVVRLRAFDGTSWTLAGGGPPAPACAGACRPSLALCPDDVPVVTCAEPFRPVLVHRLNRW